MRLHKHAYSSQPPIAMLTSSSLASFFQKQALYLSVAAVMVSVFWAVGQRINPATVVLYMLLLGNLATYPMARVRRMVSNRPFPYNWLLFLAGLFVLTPVIYIIASAVVIWIAPPHTAIAGTFDQNWMEVPLPSTRRLRCPEVFLP